MNSHGKEEFPWKIGLFGLCIGGVILFFQEIAQQFDDSRNISVNIKGEKALFQKNFAIMNDKYNGALLSGFLRNRIQIDIYGKKIIMQNTMVHFYDNGNIAKCSITQTSPTGLYIGDKTIVKNNTHPFFDELVYFYPDEYVKYIDNDESRSFNIQGKERFLSGGISFFNDGHVEECVLKNDEDFKIDSYPIRLVEKTHIRLSDKGKLIYINPPAASYVSIKYSGQFIPLKGSISLYENGKLKDCFLDKPLVVQNGRYKLRVKDKISFYPNEKIKACNLSNATSIKVNNNIIEIDEKLSFYENGNVKSGVISNRKTQYYATNKYRIMLNNHIFNDIKFYKNGALKSLYPREGASLKVGINHVILDEYELKFYEDGNVLSAYIDQDSNYNLFFNQNVFNKDHPNIYQDQLFNVVFNDNKIIAFSFHEAQVANIDEKSVYVPGRNTVSYIDFNTGEASFVQMRCENVILPENVKINGFGNYMIHNKSEDYIYALDDFNFSRFSISTNTWQPLADVPESVKNGTTIFRYGSDNTIFVYPGYEAIGIYGYSIASNTWNHPNACLQPYQVPCAVNSSQEVSDDEQYECFVKAKYFFNDEDKKSLFAKDIKEIMFEEDAIITIDGKEHVCQAMKWVNLTR